MAYATEHLAYTFEGGLPGGELWTITLRTVSAVVDDTEAAGAALGARNAFNTMWNATGSFDVFNPPTVNFHKVTCRSVSAAGVTTAQGEYVQSTPTPGIASVQTAPNQSALVVTLQTARPGRTGRGRVYMPFLAPQFGVNTDRLAAGLADPLAFHFAQFITDLGQIDGGDPAVFGPFPIAVQSTVNMAAPPMVTSVRVGDVIDTQRRRRNKVIEAYSTAAVVG